jgi:hypothetical protein
LLEETYDVTGVNPDAKKFDRGACGVWGWRGCGAARGGRRRGGLRAQWTE